jgi:hypothetical protein
MLHVGWGLFRASTDAGSSILDAGYPTFLDLPSAISHWSFGEAAWFELRFLLSDPAPRRCSALRFARDPLWAFLRTCQCIASRQTRRRGDNIRHDAPSAVVWVVSRSAVAAAGLPDSATRCRRRSLARGLVLVVRETHARSGPRKGVRLVGSHDPLRRTVRSDNFRPATCRSRNGVGNSPAQTSSRTWKSRRFHCHASTGRWALVLQCAARCLDQGVGREWLGDRACRPRGAHAAPPRELSKSSRR